MKLVKRYTLKMMDRSHERNMATILILGLLCVASVHSKAVLPSDWKNNLKAYDGQNVFFEKDMILPRSLVVRAVEKGTMDAPKRINEEGGVAETEAITAPLYRRWSNAEVPYVIDNSLKCSVFCFVTNPEKHIRRAMAAWSKSTCIKFRPKEATDRDYIHFVKSKWGHCASYVGRTGGRQPIFLGVGCRSDGTIMHEIGHALGFFHEQSRPDRDKYVKINYNNIKKKYWSNFEKYTSATRISDMGTPYDYNSIMHYKSKAFVKTWKVIFAKSIEPLKKGAKIGQRDRPSALDIKEANLYYQCPKQ